LEIAYRPVTLVVDARAMRAGSGEEDVARVAGRICNRSAAAQRLARSPDFDFPSRSTRAINEKGGVGYFLRIVSACSFLFCFLSRARNARRIDALFSHLLFPFLLSRAAGCQRAQVDCVEGMLEKERENM